MFKQQKASTCTYLTIWGVNPFHTIVNLWVKGLKNKKSLNFCGIFAECPSCSFTHNKSIQWPIF